MATTNAAKHVLLSCLGGFRSSLYSAKMSAKLPIPRLRRERREVVAGRVSRACEHCRQRRTKCDGSRPVCSQCLVYGLVDCFYPERKVIQQQKEFESMQREIEGYKDLLEEIYQGLKGPIADRVAKALNVCPCSCKGQF